MVKIERTKYIVVWVDKSGEWNSTRLEKKEFTNEEYEKFCDEADETVQNVIPVEAIKQALKQKAVYEKKVSFEPVSVCPNPKDSPETRSTHMVVKTNE